MRKGKKKIAMVFGVFDLFHPGHGSFLKQAAKQGSALIAVVARDKAVLHLKGKKPHQSERRRAKAVRETLCVTRVVLGDLKQGKYSAIKRHEPDIICLGYDQEGLHKDLRARMKTGELRAMRMIKLKPHHPKKFKTSLMRKSR